MFFHYRIIGSQSKRPGNGRFKTHVISAKLSANHWEKFNATFPYVKHTQPVNQNFVSFDHFQVQQKYQGEIFCTDTCKMVLIRLLWDIFIRQGKKGPY